MGTSVSCQRRLKSSSGSPNTLLQGKPREVCPVSGETSPGGDCPLKHGTVWADPYPGYVHGRRPAICRFGCAPTMAPHDGEDTRSRLLREAREFQELFHAARGSPPGAVNRRMDQIIAEVRKSGTYSHTFEELQTGARVAWRNAPKCANRRFWDTIEVFDRRDVKTSKGMFQACIEHLNQVKKDGVTKAYISIFPAQHPETRQGPCIWSSQLIRFAAFETPGGVVGDPANLEFTRMVQRRFGWTSPEVSPFRVLPLVVQAAGHPPESFDIPRTCMQLLDIWHPDHPGIAELGMKWTAVPAVSEIVLELGGLTYTAAPFNGWFADVEICRNLGDPDRYNMLPAIAGRLGLSTDSDASLWKDEALLTLGKAVLHSFSHSDCSMVDHHTMLAAFYTWYHNELKHRGWCPGNWKWIIPPQASTLCAAYMGLNRMTEYTLKPMYARGPGWKNFEQAHFGRGDPRVVRRLLGVLAFCAAAVGRWRRLLRSCRKRVLLVYASVNGTTRRFASVASSSLEAVGVVHVMDAEHISLVNSSAFVQQLGLCDVVLLMTASYGQGDLPTSAQGFLALLRSDAVDVLGKGFCVCGFGNSQYKHFCGAATLLDGVLTSKGARALAPPARCDELGGRQSSFDAWLLTVLGVLSPMTAGEDCGTGARGSIAFTSKQTITNLRCRGSVAMYTDKQRASYGPGLGRCPFVVEAVHTGDAEAVKGHLLEERVDSHRRDQPRERFATATALGVDALAGDSAAWASSAAPGMALVRLSLGTRMPYAAGDHLAVIPHGAQFVGLIPGICTALRLDPDDVFVVRPMQGSSVQKHEHPLVHKLLGRRTTMRRVLSWWAGLGEAVSETAAAALFPLTTDATEASALMALARSSAGKVGETTTASSLPLRWSDLFEACPSLAGRLPLEVFLSHLPLNNARLYSVASSPTAKPEEVHLIVTRFILHTAEGDRKGVASDDLSCMTPGAAVQVQVRTCRTFHLPADPSVPLIFVAAGSGLAPFRGFWQERAELARSFSLGPAVLCYGCREPPASIIGDELQVALGAGALSKVLFAMSSQEPKRYVQDVIRQHRAELRTLLEDPKCEVYLCGNNDMIDGASDALSGGSDAWLQYLQGQGRWHVDAFGAGRSARAAAGVVAQVAPSMMHDDASERHVVSRKPTAHGGPGGNSVPAAFSDLTWDKSARKQSIGSRVGGSEVGRKKSVGRPKKRAA